MRSDDLVPFLASPSAAGGSKGVGWTKGVIVSWNQNTAENTVLVRGVLVENVPILNTSEAAILQAGDVVGLLSFGSTWGILGRFTIPGTPEAVSALGALRTKSANVAAIDNITSATFVPAPGTPGPEVEIVVGPSGRLLVFISALMNSQSSNTAGNSYQEGGLMSFALSGANTLAAAANRALRQYSTVNVTSSASNFTGALGATRAVLLEGLNPGSTTVTAQYSRETASTTVSCNFFDRNITAMAL